jgi:hypothetical protein
MRVQSREGIYQTLGSLVGGKPRSQQLFSDPCPTCGVTPGERCLLHSSGPRSEPDIGRKLSAAEAIETIRIPGDPERR